MVYWGGTSRNGSFEWYKQKCFIEMVQAEMVDCDGASRDEPCHEIMELFVLRKLIFQTSMRSTAIQWARYLIFGWTLRLLLHFMCANSEGSAESGWMCRLV